MGSFTTSGREFTLGRWAVVWHVVEGWEVVKLEGRCGHRRTPGGLSLRSVVHLVERWKLVERGNGLVVSHSAS